MRATLINQQNYQQTDRESKQLTDRDLGTAWTRDDDRVTQLNSDTGGLSKTIPLPQSQVTREESQKSDNLSATGNFNNVFGRSFKNSAKSKRKMLKKAATDEWCQPQLT